LVANKKMNKKERLIEEMKVKILEEDDEALDRLLELFIKTDWGDDYNTIESMIDKKIENGELDPKAIEFIQKCKTLRKSLENIGSEFEKQIEELNESRRVLNALAKVMQKRNEEDHDENYKILLKKILDAISLAPFSDYSGQKQDL